MFRVFSILFYVFILAFPQHSCAQVPKFKNPDDCIDWFLVSWETVERRHAVVGHGEFSRSDGSGLVEIDWFEVKCFDPKAKKNLHYCESRFSSQESPNSFLGTPWSRSLSGGDKLLVRVGKLSDELQPMDYPVVDEKGNASGFENEST